MEAVRALLEEVLERDSLTGVGNRRHYDGVIGREIKRAERYGNPCSLIFIDPDRFKSINDTHGHAAGDAALQAIARVLKNKVRKGVDTVCRYGGDEFAIILSETNIAGAAVVAEQLRKAVEAENISFGGQILKATISVGCTEWKKGMKEADMKREADEAMYQSKRGGRNRTTVYGESHEQENPVSERDRQVAEALLRQPDEIATLLHALRIADPEGAEKQLIALGMLPQDSQQRITLLEALLEQAKKGTN